jgi:hypothetical protein
VEAKQVTNMTKSKLRSIRFVFVLSVMLAFPGAAPALQDQKQPPSKDSKSASNSMTGCVDEQNGNYVLTNDTDLALIATLQADGFPTEAFAKHMGHKVTVRGTTIPGEGRPTFKVRSIATVSDTCAPQRQME